MHDSSPGDFRQTPVDAWRDTSVDSDQELVLEVIPMDGRASVYACDMTRAHEHFSIRFEAMRDPVQAQARTYEGALQL